MKYIFLVIIILMIPFVSASSPDFSVVFDFEEYFQIGEQEIGKLVFLEKQPIGESFELFDIENTNVEIYDKIVWRGNNTIEIVSSSGQSEIVSKDGQYVFTSTGVYEIRRVSNNSIAANVFVGDTINSIITLKIEDEDDELEFVYDKEFELDGEISIPINTIINGHDDPGNYKVTISIQSENKNITEIKYIEIPNLKNWNITNNNLTAVLEVESDSYIDVGHIELDNHGNSNVEISTSISGELSQYFNIIDKKMLPAQSSIFIGVVLQIPSRIADGLYPTTITFTGDNYTYNHQINITIKDLIVPTIKNVTIDNDKVYVDTEMQVIVEDNVDVDRVILNHEAVNYTMRKDRNLFIYNFIPKIYGERLFIVCAYDAVNNSVCRNETFEFKKLDLVKPFESQTAHPRKTDKFAVVDIFNLTGIPPENKIAVVLDSFYVDVSNETEYDAYTIRIIDGDGTKKQLLNTGDSVLISEPGIIQAEIRGTIVSEYDVSFSVRVPEYIEEVKTITVTGKFLDYDVPNAFEKDWFGKKLTCEPFDTGNPDTSYIQCEVQFPITADVESLAIPTTIEEEELLEAELNETKRDFQNQTVIYILFIGGLFGMSFVLVFAIIYYIKIHSLLRLKLRRK